MSIVAAHLPSTATLCPTKQCSNARFLVFLHFHIHSTFVLKFKSWWISVRKSCKLPEAPTSWTLEKRHFCCTAPRIVHRCCFRITATGKHLWEIDGTQVKSTTLVATSTTVVIRHHICANKLRPRVSFSFPKGTSPYSSAVYLRVIVAALCVPDVSWHLDSKSKRLVLQASEGRDDDGTTNVSFPCRAAPVCDRHEDIGCPPVHLREFRGRMAVLKVGMNVWKNELIERIRSSYVWNYKI